MNQDRAMTKQITHYEQINPYHTKDGSMIRELMHPREHGNRRQSLAEATIHPGQITTLHKHLRAEELYHVVNGRGIMTLGGDRFAIRAGDTIPIAPGTPHQVANDTALPLVILCCCAPPYSHDDTLLLE